MNDTHPAPESLIRWSVLPRRLLLIALSVDVLLLLVYAGAAVIGLTKDRLVFDLIDLNMEANIPTMWQALQLFSVGVVLLMLASPLFRAFPRVADLKRLWMVLGIGFVFLSFDEGGVIHERISKILARGAGVGSKSAGEGIVASALHHLGFKASFRGGGLWMLLYAAIAVGLAVWLAPLIVRALRTWPRESLLFLAGFAILFTGGVILESAQYFFHFVRAGFIAEVGLEEFCESIGQSIALFGVVSLLAVAAEAMQAAAAPPAKADESAA